MSVILYIHAITCFIDFFCMYMYNGLCDVICVGASKVLVKGGMCVFPNDD